MSDVQPTSATAAATHRQTQNLVAKIENDSWNAHRAGFSCLIVVSRLGTASVVSESQPIRQSAELRTGVRRPSHTRPKSSGFSRRRERLRRNSLQFACQLACSSSGGSKKTASLRRCTQVGRRQQFAPKKFIFGRRLWRGGEEYLNAACKQHSKVRDQNHGVKSAVTTNSFIQLNNLTHRKNRHRRITEISAPPPVGFRTFPRHC